MATHDPQSIDLARLVAMLAVLFWILRVLIPIRRRQKEDDTP